jgi:hypothetical protein
MNFDDVIGKGLNIQENVRNGKELHRQSFAGGRRGKSGRGSSRERKDA